ncbi:MAG: hypothetical protein LKG05_08725 [Clostridium tyrobutyricum]|nr:hypothetical protein [Clostridium tyrobutyricum]MCH4199614.1 hypothetical protein [Clostridium tyrobutyricum]MCI1239672.1 hypothetical protein [Clostridium tyrobutyricum]
MLYLIKIMPHGILEILGLSVGVYIGNTLKDRDFKGKLRLFVIGIFLIIISALIEIKISYNI